MTAKFQRVLLWCGMFALAFAGGSWLGGFTVAGLAGSDYGMADASANEARQFWNKLSADRTARARPPTELPEHLTYVEPAHVCEGCDAGETRYRQLAQSLGLFYDEAAAEARPSMTSAEPAGQFPQPRLPELSGAAIPPGRPRVPPPPSVPALPPRP